MAESIYSSSLGFNVKPPKQPKNPFDVLFKKQKTGLNTSSGITSAFKQIKASGRALPKTLKGAKDQNLVDSIYKQLAQKPDPTKPTSGVSLTGSGDVSTSLNFNDKDLLDALVQKQLIDTGQLDQNQLSKLQQQKPGFLEKLGRFFSFVDPVQFYVGGPLNIAQEFATQVADAKIDKKITPGEGLGIAAKTIYNVATQFPLGPTGINPLAAIRKVGTALYDTFLNNEEESITERQYGQAGDKIVETLRQVSEAQKATGKPEASRGIDNLIKILTDKKLGSFSLPILGNTDITPAGLLNFGDMVADFRLKAPFSVLEGLKATGLVKGNLFNKVANVGADLKDAASKQEEIDLIMKTSGKLGTKGNNFDELATTVEKYLKSNGKWTDDLEQILSNLAPENRFKTLLNELYAQRTATSESFKDLIKRNFNQFVSESDIRNASGDLGRAVDIVSETKGQQSMNIFNDFISKKNLPLFRPPTVDLSRQGELLLEKYKDDYREIASNFSKEKTAKDVLEEVLYKPANRISEDILTNPELTYDNLVDYGDDIASQIGRKQEADAVSYSKKLLAPVRRYQEDVIRGIEDSAINRVVSTRLGVKGVDVSNEARAYKQQLVDALDDTKTAETLFSEFDVAHGAQKTIDSFRALENNSALKQKILSYIKGDGKREWFDAMEKITFPRSFSRDQITSLYGQLDEATILSNIFELNSNMPTTLAKFPSIRKAIKDYRSIENSLLKELETVGRSPFKIIGDYLTHILPGELPNGFKVHTDRAGAQLIIDGKFIPNLDTILDFHIRTRLDLISKTMVVRRLLNTVSDPASFLANPMSKEFTKDITEYVSKAYGREKLKTLNALFAHFGYDINSLRKILRQNNLASKWKVIKNGEKVELVAGKQIENLNSDDVNEVITALTKSGDEGIIKTLRDVTGEQDSIAISSTYESILYDLKKNEKANSVISTNPSALAKITIFEKMKDKLPKGYSGKTLEEVMEDINLLESKKVEVQIAKDNLERLISSTFKTESTKARVYRELSGARDIIEKGLLKGLDDTQIQASAPWKKLTGSGRKIAYIQTRLGDVFSDSSTAYGWLKEMPAHIFSKSGLSKTEMEFGKFAEDFTSRISNYSQKITSRSPKADEMNRLLNTAQIDDNTRSLISAMYMQNPFVDYQGGKIPMRRLLGTHGVEGLRSMFMDGKISTNNLKADFIEEGIVSATQMGLIDTVIGKAMGEMLSPDSKFSPETRSSVLGVLTKVGNLQKQYMVATLGTQFGNLFGNAVTEALYSFGNPRNISNIKENSRITNYVVGLIYKNQKVRAIKARALDDSPYLVKKLNGIFETFGGLAINPALDAKSAGFTGEARDIIEVISSSEKFKSSTIFSEYTSDIGEILSNYKELGPKAKEFGKKANKYTREWTALNEVGQQMDIYHMTNMARRFLQDSGGNIGAATDKFNKWYINFSALTPFEQTITKRVLLFYPWFRSNFVNTMREAFSNSNYSKNVNSLYQLIEQMQTDELRDKQHNLPYNSYFRNTFWIGNPEQFIVGLRTPIEAAGDFGRLIPVISGSSISDSIKALAGNTQLPISIASSLIANRDSRTNEVINPFNDPYIRADIEGYTKAPAEWASFLKSMPPAVQRLMSFGAVENPITLETEYRMDPFINYVSEQSIAQFRLPNQIYKLAKSVPQTSTDPSKLPKELISLVTGYRVKGASELGRITKSEELNQKANLQKLLNVRGVLSARQELYGTPGQLSAAGLPRSVKTETKAKAFRASGQNYYEFNSLLKVKDASDKARKKQEKNRAKLLKQKIPNFNKLKQIKPLKINTSKL